MTTHQTFGEVLAETRKTKGLSQKELAALIKKEDGEPISPQYLNDIEHDRRNPPSDEILLQMATVLGIPPDYLFHLAGKLPADIARMADASTVVEAYKVFRKTLKGK